MTYCAAIKLKDGLIFASDTRTNAGIDHISTFRKLYTYCQPGERLIVLQSAGNLATSQAVYNRIKSDMDDANSNSMLEINSLYEAASLVGRYAREVASSSREIAGKQDGFTSSFLLGGQIKGQPPELYNIYTEGNCIAASEETPYFQIGELKYGKPILDRSINHESTLDEAMRAILISFDSTIRSNLSVGMPIDMVVYHKDSFTNPEGKRIEENDPYFNSIRDVWSEGLREVLGRLPAPPDDYSA